jgi:hypothetical protein
MANQPHDDMRITPLVMAVCTILWGVLFALMAWNLSTTVEMARSLNNIPGQVQDIEQRVRALEAKR